ncbi:Putative GroES-like superfamily, alcohol dehydrogenase-like, NAD(P)-binding domain superfamily [Septoria linicola]|uniref:GroES-like superfamily, alcohol dehydrogenase-like, NAD(P)-binding domain superfamily n=1 Tax=Septoria linicola TaxID=215465 RepID=A0A9Q9AY99_9PEZI|nr:putative GroES-like superfamily, alcohol dehydrogenase-like, NAD(P)-binding domain superfamily [Septoria linicola]USW54730.1 Putative GroES-like superfamily, alcohol dehydrogenase-like, NAD(P)-binding domain superfamily [Septoria linicola]
MPTIQSATDAIVRISTAAVCGSDLHYYRGTYGHSDPPWYMGHEALGYVEDIGEDVIIVNRTDRVGIPDITATHDVWSLTEQLGPAFGVGGGLGGCQDADRNLFVIPVDNSTAGNSSTRSDLAWLMLSDVFPTGWAGLDYSGFLAGDTVAVFGAGPVGIMSAYSAILRGAARVFVVDYVQERLDLATSIGATAINFQEGDPVDQILALEPDGVVRSVDCVGYEALNADLQHQEDVIINQMIRLTMVNGGIGGIGVWGDAHSNNTQTVAGALVTPNIIVDMGSFWGKHLSMRSGGVNAIEYIPHLAELIATGVAHPGLAFSDIVGIEDAPDAYARFERHEAMKIAIHFP